MMTNDEVMGYVLSRMDDRQREQRDAAIYSIAEDFLQCLRMTDVLELVSCRMVREDWSQDVEGFEVIVRSWDDGEVGDRLVTINRDTIISALTELALGNVFVGHRSTSDVARGVLFGAEGPCNESDLATSYFIVQVGMFGEVLYI